VKLFETLIFKSSDLYSCALQFQNSVDFLEVIFDLSSNTKAEAYTFPSFLFVKVSLKLIIIPSFNRL
jgi:hypothetical protein